jgi:hypothetical protein
MVASVVAKELQEQLLAWEEKAKIFEMALVKLSADLDAKQANIDATRKEYLDKMEVHTTRNKITLGLYKMLGEKKVQLDGREWDLDLHEATLVESQFHGLNSQDNCEGLMKLIELWRHLKEVEVDSVAEAGHLVILTADILDAVNTILECQ